MTVASYVTGSFSKRRYLSKCSGYPVAVNTYTICNLKLGNDGDILSTENPVTLTMQLGHVNYMQCGTHSEVFAG